SPVRIDIAGGWTDTPPFCLMEGGNVSNLAIELNGQPPLQAYVRPCAEPHIVCRSIDLGAAETIETYEQLRDFNKVGSPFSIPKAALALAGFHPQFCTEHFASLRDQLMQMGGGLEITLFSAIPAGSGLGTSSILASTVLGAISDFCALAWDKTEICKRTLILEQLLTTGGGWQDQYGGVIGGVKLLQSTKELAQEPLIRRLPSDLFTDPQYAPCHLLFYTGITRTAKDILAEIVRRMFLNHGEQIGLLREMKNHTMEMYDAIQRDDFARMGRLVRRTWQQNMTLDHGTNPPGVDAITRLVDDLCLGYKLPGAGGGGYLYMIAKDPEAAGRIRHILTTDSSLPANSRMVEMSLSHQGLQITRS
ncbi:MAG: bifunctional fucokinase/L-fucose-1-P-guanylyltransferase, partial [Duncaniella sp.]|nr:bifunctional fucokinase/L-fucose-1-P-guanylyltransferase [Duncaniella sp.]